MKAFNNTKTVKFVFFRPEMEFLIDIFLVEVSGHKLESSQTRVFVCFSTTKMLIMNRVEFSCFAFFCNDFKNHLRVMFSLKSASSRNCE
jgi:hypothetical protein